MHTYIYRTSLKSINLKQKEALAKFMSEHTSLAKNLLPNYGQARVTANKLWEALTLRLNIFGLPIKNAKAWRKVYTDQKFNVKKKVSFSKASKNKTGGGPYEEMLLSSADEQILDAAGIQVSVEGLSDVETFGSVQTTTNEALASEADQPLHMLMDSTIELGDESECEEENKKCKVNTKSKGLLKSTTKLELIKVNMDTLEQHQINISLKLDRLIEIKERSLQLKEKEHAANMHIKNIDIEMKSIQLEALKKTHAGSLLISNSNT